MGQIRATQGACERRAIDWLTDYDNAAVRCYAFLALASRNSNRVFEILLKRVSDGEIVSTQYGCNEISQRTGDYFINVVTRGADADSYRLSPAERERLDDILINDRAARLEERAFVLRKTMPTPKSYARIRELASTERDDSALRALARYRKQEDKDLIATFFKTEATEIAALYAVREFPDESFYPLVTTVFEQGWRKTQYDYQKWRVCYQVLAQYPGPLTLALFQRTLDAKDKFKHETLGSYLLVAITKYPNELFDPLKSSLVLKSQDQVKDALKYDD